MNNAVLAALEHHAARRDYRRHLWLTGVWILVAGAAMAVAQLTLNDGPLTPPDVTPVAVDYLVLVLDMTVVAVTLAYVGPRLIVSLLRRRAAAKRAAAADADLSATEVTVPAGYALARTTADQDRARRSVLEHGGTAGLWVAVAAGGAWLPNTPAFVTATDMHPDAATFMGIAIPIAAGVLALLQGALGIRALIAHRRAAARLRELTAIATAKKSATAVIVVR